MAGEFNFFSNWYPVLPLEDIDPQRPTPIIILGIRLVIWKPPTEQTFRIFLDQCPHRLAPLSEGRIDEQTGNLMCSYHGWQFDHQGICTRIPQADNLELIAKNQANFSILSLPVRQEQDLLWVWMDAKSVEQAEATPLPLSPQIDTSKGFTWSSYVRDVEYDWDTLIENVVDPSHVPFSHHGVQGNRAAARSVPIDMTKSKRNLIEGVIDRQMLKTTITFAPPCLVEYASSIESNGKQFGIVAYCIPTTPGKSRLIALFPQNSPRTFHRFKPRWWDHINERNLVMEGDMILLHHQEHYLQQQEQLNGSWKTAYKLPTSADRFVIEFRNWFDDYCYGQLPWSKLGTSSPQIKPINGDRSKLLNTYQQHTQNCRSCRNALKNIEIIQVVLLVFSVITVCGAAILGDDLRVRVGLPLVIVALSGLAAYTWLKFWLTPKFYFVDYVHSRR